MKLCFSTLACPAWNLRQIIDAAVEHQIAGVDFRGLGEEIDITRLPAFSSELEATLASLRERGLEIPCFNTSVTLVSPSSERWDAMLQECRRYAHLAQRSQTKYLRIFGGAVQPGMTRDEARMMATRHLRQLTKICRPMNCQVVLETHDEWATAAQIMELVHEFSPDEVGVLWDIEHPYRRGESPWDTAQGLSKYIRHTHFKDSLRAEGKSSPKLMGEGDLPIRDCVQALRSIGYDGWICLETEKRWDTSAPDPEQSIAQFASYMRQIIGPGRA